MPSILQRTDYEDFLIRLYFGPGGDRLQACWQRAYRDFNRTLHGIKKHPGAYLKAKEALSHKFASVRRMNAPTQAQFDKWHRSACEGLAATYRECGYRKFSVGQAQKWLNMSFKYIYALRLRGFGRLYDLCHVPLDRILIEALGGYGFRPLPCAWSRLNDYDIYLDRQRWVRSRFQLAPLDVEFRLFMGCPPTK